MSDTSLGGTGTTAFTGPTSIMLHLDGATLVTIRPTGVIEYGPNYTPDAAAKVFWEALGNSMPEDRKRVGELEAELELNRAILAGARNCILKYVPTSIESDRDFTLSTIKVALERKGGA